MRVQRIVPLAAVVAVISIGVPFAVWRITTGSSPATTSGAPRNHARLQPPLPPLSTAQCEPNAAIAKWPLAERLAQLLIVGLEPNTAQQILSRYPLGGIYINAATTSQVSADSAVRFNSYTRIPPLVGIDEEGGRIQRIPQLVGSMPSARVMAATMTPSQVQALAFSRGQALKRYGITVDFAPVADVSAQPNDGVIGDRSFSNDPTVVAEYAGAFAAGLRQAGVIPILKHFPGHGHALGDSHNQIAVAPNLANLELSDLLPYKTLLMGNPVGVMVGHLDVPGLTDAQQPATISPAAINGLLRTQLGFTGFVVTDDLETMVAITRNHTLPEATFEALQAGSTMALSKFNDQVGVVLDTLAAAVRSRSLPETVVNNDVAEVLRLKGVDPCALPPGH